MSSSLVGFEKQQLVRCRILAELCRRRLPGIGGWSHWGAQCGTEPTSLALLALYSYPSGAMATRAELLPLLAFQQPNGLWPAVDDRVADVNFWASALAVNTLMAVGTTPEKVGASLDALVHCRPREASWLARLRFCLSDRRVRFDPSKYGWPWVPDTVSWVLPTSMALITLEHAKQRGWIRGTELEHRLRLGAEMLLDRACLEGGWDAGNAVVYGVPSRPHIDATALALAALRFHYRRPIVCKSMTWVLEHIESSSAYNLAWIILAAAAYKDVRADVLPAIDIARNRLAALLEDPRTVEDTSTIALAALALGPEGANNPFEVKL